MPGVGSAANYQVNMNPGNSAAAIRESIKKTSTSDLVSDFARQTILLEKYLTEARQKMLDTGRAALRQEVRKVEAILNSKDYTTLVYDLPEVRFLGNKKNNDLAREAKVLLQQYNTTSEFFYKPIKEELISRGVDTYNISNLAEKEGAVPEVDQAAIEELKKILERNTNPGTQVYWGIGILAMIFLIKKRNAKR